VSAGTDTKTLRDQTDDKLRAERERSNEELLHRSDALAEDSEELIRIARERAAAVLQLAREREDEQLERIKADTRLRRVIESERRTHDGALTTERVAADMQRLDDRERRRLAMLQLLALERAATDRTLETERTILDRSLSAHVDMLAVVAHDLRNLLSVLVINAATIAIAPDIGTAVPLAEMIQKAGAQMNILLEDLLDFSSMESGQLNIRCAKTDVVLLVRDVITIHRPAAQANDIGLDLACPFDSFTIDADVRRLSRVLINLLSNAIKFTPRHGRIVVELAPFEAGIELTVSDTGPGIPERELESIFERYRQGSGMRDRSTGVGLGLFIARAVVTAHGGTIWAENKAGGGAVFHARIPLCVPTKK
jgi:signal transduction histidine kinase